MNRLTNFAELGLCLLIVLSSRAVLAEELPGEINADAQAAQEIDAAVQIIGDDSQDIEDRLKAVHILYLGREHWFQDEKARSAAEKGIPVLTRALQNVSEGEERLSTAISWTLMSFGPDAKEAVPTLLKVLRAESRTEEAYHARTNAAAALKTLCATEAVPLLASIAASQDAAPDSKLEREHQRLRMQAAVSLAHIYAEEHFQKYDFNRSQAGHAREQAAQAAKTQEEIETSFQTLVDETQDIKDRIAAAWTLGRHGANANLAVPALVRILDEKKDYPGVVLAGLTNHEYVVGSFWHDNNKRVHYPVKFQLALAADAAPVGLGASLREAAADALGRMESRDAVPALIRALENSSAEEDHLRITICGALVRFGPDAKAAVPALLEILQEDFAYLAEQAYPRLNTSVEAYALRLNVAAALGAIRSPEALPLLEKTAEKINETWRNRSGEEPSPQNHFEKLHLLLRAQLAAALEDLYMAKIRYGDGI